ncbi:glycoside hydrolase [Corynebacterium yudongzhengii]|uniref:Glycoside hydrolase n=1 Tax=Corynebacterium yudongzhengii TaxID=2080740 RepID=A0A2U1T720_9CORY|nr:C40 family peptidase [Corynebacterium yudongzhengii]AWB81351.1 glycoside hydrolase [Corynebacterium yudongzhengii]PWC01794.1 glycoside hydrolase [Corynebacterium yudongzhengii]
MNEIVSTLKHLDALRPPSLPAFEVPALPDLAALHPLAEAMNGETSLIDDTLRHHGLQRADLTRLVSSAAAPVRSAQQDLVALGMSFLQRALPLAAAALMPDPAAALSARAELMRLATNTAQEALAHLGQLEGDLRPIIADLDSLAAGDDPELRTTPQMAAEEPPEPVRVEPAAHVEERVVDNPEDAGDAAAGQRAVDAALTQLGRPYVWGGTGENGFDCSGLTQWAYRQAGVEIPRTADQQAVGTQVSAEELQPGDLAVWDGHVAMYIGDGQMVEAGDPVQTNPVRTNNMGMAFQGFYRPTAQ